MGQSQSGSTPTIKVCITSKIVVNQLIGILEPHEASFSPSFALAYIPPAATLFTARANSSGAARLLRYERWP